MSHQETGSFWCGSLLCVRRYGKIRRQSGVPVVRRAEKKVKGQDMGKALFFDIDGTLVNFQGQMPDSARQALRQAKEKGHMLVICSGRSVSQIYPWLLDMEFDGLIAASGAYVEHGHQVVYEHHMDEKTAARVCSLLEEAHAVYSVQTRRRVVATKDCAERMRKRFQSMRADMDAAEKMNIIVETVENPGQRPDIEKFNFFDSGITIAEIRERLREDCDVTAMSFDIPTERDGEISSRGINKALGIRKFIEHAGIPREDTVAFGDGANDLDMLAYAQVGVVMGNALDEIKERADYVTDAIDEDGLAHAMSALSLV